MQLQKFTEFTVRAENEEDREDWFSALMEEVEQDPVRKMQRQRQMRKAQEEAEERGHNTTQVRHSFACTHRDLFPHSTPVTRDR